MIELKKDYFSYHLDHLGMEARYQGKVICKAQAYEIEKTGKGSWIEWHEKPGWKKGILFDDVLYQEYRQAVLFL